MKRKVGQLRLSPNEEARVIREELERRRKLRIQQVREQQRCIAQQIRQEVQKRRQRELEQLGEELRADWERQQREKINTLQQLYQESLQLLGQGHRSAKENEPDLAAIAQREEENQTKAKERYREALKELKSHRLKEHERQSRSINARKKALQAEKERSAKVASLPPPPPNPIQNIDSRKPHVVKKSDVSAFAATHYHMPENIVDREVDPEQPDAHEGAELEVRRLQDLQKEEKRRREEQLEKARLRGKQALRRELLVQDRERLLVELEHMQQTDLQRRRQQVSQMPPQIFQPLCKRQETREDFQREMEFAFEDMYTGERRVKGDLVVQLVPEPLPALSTGSGDQDLDVTVDESATPGTENIQHDTEQEAGSSEQDASVQVEPSRPAPRRALKKLLDRIRSQRNQWTDHSSRVPAASSPTVISDQVPERDSTIDTGSLTSEPPGPAHSPPALEPTERSAAADARPPVALDRRIQEFTEERKKREEELEREKQQQVVLLQELEEQKAKLEQMLLEAQQEREHLKAAVTQEVPVNQPEAPVHDQEVTSIIPGLTAELEPPPGEDEHARRIREYQQRLLEQNRLHQRSVEVARQRLAEYQRALQIRYGMTATSFLPAIMPAGLIQPPLHSTGSAHPPTALPLSTPPAVPAYIQATPQTSMEVPPRESDMLAAPPRLSGSRLLLNELESVSNSHRNQRLDVSALLTDNIMERVTEHLPERVRPFLKPHSTSIPLQPASDPIQAVSPGTTDGAPLVPGQAEVKLGTLPHGSLLTGSLSSREGDMERQRRELQEVQRRLLEQREAVVLQQRRQEERQRQEEEMEKMRRQKETLQTLIHADEPVPEAASEALGSDNIRQTRLKLLASLLRAIEESNGGTLSHLEDPQEEDGSPQQTPSNSGETDPIVQSNVAVGPPPPSALPSGPLPPPRAAKPPVTRVRLGVLEMMPEQHELSAIQEMDTPVNTSQVTGLEDGVQAPSCAVDWDPQEEPESSVASDRTLQTPSWSSSGQRTAERPVGSGTSSRGPSHAVCRERLLMRAKTSPESSECDPVLRIISPLSSDSGRGADYSGPALTSFRSPSEAALRPPDSDCLSSTTISTGSYITTDPEQNLNTDNSLPLRRVGRGQRADVSPPSGQSSCIEDSSAAGRPGPTVESLFNDSSIQRIIDRYTRELNISLNTTGKTTDGEGSSVEEPGSLVRVSERREEEEDEDESSTAHQSLPSHAAGAQRSGLERDDTVHPILEHFSGEDPSLAEDHEQDSFRPLIGQLADQSSCLAADQGEAPMEQLVSQPWAHSSMIGQLPGLPASVSLDQGGWDSTLNRMIGRLSHQSSSLWLSGGLDFYAGQLMGHTASEPSTTWLDAGPDESRMRLLVGELDESAGQHSGSSGGRTHVDLGVSTEASVPSYPALPPETSVPGVSPHPQAQTSVMDLGPERTEDSFHQLLAEVTHNDTADPSMIFHLPAHDEGRPASEEHSVSTSSEESEPSPERLRSEEPSRCVTASPASSQLITSQCLPHESVLMMSPTTKTDVELTAERLSDLTMCDDAPALSLPEEPLSDLCAGELKGSNLRNAVSVAEKILEAASEKGILEQSEITLVSLTDTTLQDHETSVTEDEGLWEDKPGLREEGHDTEVSESMLSKDETPEDENQSHPVRLLQFEWGPSRGLQDVHQQRRRALLQRSSRRVQEIKARGARAKIQPEVQTEAREPSKAQPVTCKAKTKSEPQHETKTRTKGGQAEQRPTTESSDLHRQKKPPLPPPGSDSRLNRVDEMKISTPQQRKEDISKMHQRTQRLYEQLEEVKHQREVRSRQEACANNRLKAKEFHKKTLERLRAKRTLQ
ncbi:uncharacterized protein cep295 [Chaetodon trifascialis]|uniref:uncharacterized protein cep295 n=1 Tax=Chaetodon trifascialis TaxID=109706 RepID=UPI0039967302